MRRPELANRFSMPPGSEIRWPPVCVACGGVPIFHAIARGTAFARLSWWVIGYTIHYRKVSVVYPVCARHLRASRVFNFLFGTGVVIAVSGVIANFFASGRIEIVITLGIASIGMMLSFYSAFAPPIRVRPSAEDGILITIVNEIYARQFQRANAQTFESFATAKRRRQESSSAYRFGERVARMFRGRS